LDATRDQVTVTPLDRHHIAVATPWIDGSILGYEAECTSASLETMPLAHKGRFVVLAGKPRAVPQLPRDASTDGRFVAYPSGRVFALGGKVNKENDFILDAAHVWDFTDGVHPTAVALPSVMRRLVQGREERETLALGPKSIARFDGTTWTEKPLEFLTEESTISVGDDGSVWIIGSAALWRGTFPDLEFVKMPLPHGAEPTTVVARDANDVWVIATDGNKRVLLHSQATPGTLSLSQEAATAVLGEKDPSPFSPDCKVPFFILGTEDEVTESDVRAFAEKAQAKASFFGTPMLARIRSGKVYGVTGRFHSREPASSARKLIAFQASEKAKHPKLRLVCTVPVEEKNLL
jgi:hypothetical protein